MIIIIDNYDSFTFNLYQLIAQQVREVRVFRNDRITIEELKDLKPDAIILSPGPGRPEDAGVCVQTVIELYSEIPILGICLGHQAIAYAFGCKIVRSEQIVHGKDSPIFHCRKNIYKDLPLPFKAGRYHSLTVDRARVPSEIVIEAESAEGEIMGIKHRDYPVYGMQFHPESVLTPEGAKLIANFVREVVSC